MSNYTTARAAARTIATFGEKGFLFGYLCTQWVHTGKADAKGNADAREAGKVTLAEFAELAQVTDDTITNYRKSFKHASEMPEYADYAELFAVDNNAAPVSEVPSEFTSAIKDRSPLFTAAGWRTVNTSLKDSRKSRTPRVNATGSETETVNFEAASTPPVTRTRENIVADIDALTARLAELHTELEKFDANN